MPEPPNHRCQRCDRGADLDRRLEAMRQQGDPEADALAAHLLATSPAADERDLVRSVLRQLGAPGQRDVAVYKWMADGPSAPGWVRPELVEEGQRFFGDWVFPITTALFCASLPVSYAARKGVEVLARTSDLATGNLVRRTAETTQLLIDVMALGEPSFRALAPGSQGFVSVRGVRLLHAVVRQALLSPTAQPPWPPANGIPVNQEDLLGTLLTFTTVVLDGLDRLGVPYPAEGAEAYLHTWSHVGALLGVDETFLPLDRVRAGALACCILRRQHHPSTAGTLLMDVLLRRLELVMPWGARKAPRTLVRRMAGDHVADLLGMPRAAWWAPALGAVARLGPGLGRVPGVRRVFVAPSAVLGRWALRGYVDGALDGEHPSFRVPDAALERLALGGSPLRRRARDARRRTRARLRRPRPQPPPRTQLALPPRMETTTP